MTDTQAELLARARLLRRQCQSAMTSEEADRMFARALQSEREAGEARARRAAIEECSDCLMRLSTQYDQENKIIESQTLDAADDALRALASPAAQEETL